MRTLPYPNWLSPTNTSGSQHRPLNALSLHQSPSSFNRSIISKNSTSAMTLSHPHPRPRARTRIFPGPEQKNRYIPPKPGGEAVSPAPSHFPSPSLASKIHNAAPLRCPSTVLPFPRRGAGP
ncbi:hypothetical protein CALVIDRAFT_118281 [Calocera viscosa TUFC12733]|uniref:Uncharacterized protein n=1 Tax=Calocera viscosa (strain TUFC12733) TaxID=1330018 RepID=A0A167MA48_CALVF|nr:hypothetical protein CALVIDRAFT_118281 [Calocera viscosa TUFC12733]